MKILSPAKINLMLRILSQRQDGYHLLQTYFQILDWGDNMEFKLSDKNTITVSGNFCKLKQIDNLIYKAAKLLQPHKKINSGIHIIVEKIIPQGSGLGGGSSNAGTTLRILNELWQCDLSQQQLQKFAIQLGADVPIFVLNQSAMALGVGEELTPLTIKPYYYVLLLPEISITTADVFNDKCLIKNQNKIEISNITNKMHWTNCCLPVVLKNYPLVADIYNKASKMSTTYMSGTGSTLFCCFDSKTKAQAFIDNCPQHWHAIVSKSKIN